jgi:hypothetical protein
LKVGDRIGTPIGPGLVVRLIRAVATTDAHGIRHVWQDDEVRPLPAEPEVEEPEEAPAP